jgi:hypothetical protein
MIRGPYALVVLRLLHARRITRAMDPKRSQSRRTIAGHPSNPSLWLHELAHLLGCVQIVPLSDPSHFPSHIPRTPQIRFLKAFD